MTQNIINRIQARVLKTDSALKKFQETYQSTLPILKADTQQFGEALRALGEIKGVLDEIQSEMAVGIGHLSEGEDALEQIGRDHAHAATLIINLIDVYMQSDYRILVQALEKIGPAARQQALEALTAQEREQLFDDLMKIKLLEIRKG